MDILLLPGVKDIENIDAPKCLRMLSVLETEGFIVVSNLVPEDLRYKMTTKGMAFLITDTFVERAERLKLELSTKKFVYKSRYVPHFISGLALMVAVAAYLKPAENKEILLLQDKKPESHTPKIDSLYVGDTLHKKNK